MSNINEYNEIEYSVSSRDDEANAGFKEGRLSIPEKKQRVFSDRLKLLIASIAALLIVGAPALIFAAPDTAIGQIEIYEYGDYLEFSITCNEFEEGLCAYVIANGATVYEQTLVAGNNSVFFTHESDTEYTVEVRKAGDGTVLFYETFKTAKK